jgi:hypothetical protein
MSILRLPHDKQNPYVMLNKKALEDENLSWAAKGLWAYLISKPDNWKVSVAHLCKIYKAKGGGERAIYAILNELIENGYCIRQKLRNDKGLYGETEYIIQEFKNILPHRSERDVVQRGRVESAHINKGDLPSTESSSKEEPAKEEKNEDDDLKFSDFQREQLNNFSTEQVAEAMQRTKDFCKSKANSSRVKFFFKTITNLKETPSKEELLAAKQVEREKRDNENEKIKKENKVFTEKLIQQYCHLFHANFNFSISDSAVIVKQNLGYHPLSLLYKNFQIDLKSYIKLKESNGF